MSGDIERLGWMKRVARSCADRLSAARRGWGGWLARDKLKILHVETFQATLLRHHATRLPAFSAFVGSTHNGANDPNGRAMTDEPDHAVKRRSMSCPRSGDTMIAEAVFGELTTASSQAGRSWRCPAVRQALGAKILLAMTAGG
jgi:hypothetical protein